MATYPTKMPGVDTDLAANELHPNAVAQKYYEAGGERDKGEAKPTAYDPVKPPTEEGP